LDVVYLMRAQRAEISLTKDSDSGIINRLIPDRRCCSGTLDSFIATFTIKQAIYFSRRVIFMRIRSKEIRRSRKRADERHKVYAKVAKAAAKPVKVAK
jgi:hypothetical protein